MNQGTNHKLIYCDVVAWFNRESRRVFDCAGSRCSQQRYPLPGGHWGSPYKIRSLKNKCGERVSDGDVVYYSRIGTIDNYYLRCTPSWCGAPATMALKPCSKSRRCGDRDMAGRDAIPGPGFSRCSGLKGPLSWASEPGLAILPPTGHRRA